MDFFKKLKDVFVKSVPDTSEAGKIDKVDSVKLIKTGVLVGIAAAISSVMTTMAPDTFGPYQAYITLGLTVALDFINKIVKNNK